MFHKIYYINLDRRKDRREHMETELKKINFKGKIERVEGIDGKKLNRDNITSELITSKAVEDAYNPTLNAFGGEMTLGAIGCALSHYNCYVKVINECNDDEYVLILEDDITFEDNFLYKYKQYIKRIPTFDFLLVGFANYITYPTTHPDPLYYKIYKSYGLYGYVINKKAAKLFISVFPLSLQIDSLLYTVYKKMRTFALSKNKVLVKAELSEFAYQFGTDAQTRIYEDNYIPAEYQSKNFDVTQYETLYPEITPYHRKMYTVDTINTIVVKIYVECCGNPAGIPILYLHGGPGGRISTFIRRLFNPKKYNIILFDQRGCGNSKPNNLLEHNTTDYLIKDIEFIRKTFNIDRWIIAGGSWGSTLGMIYSIQYPERILGLLLRGFYDLTLNREVLDSMYPELKSEILEILKLKPSTATIPMLKKSYKYLISTKNNKTRKRLIDLLSDSNSANVMSSKSKETMKDKEVSAIISSYYEANNFFIDKNYIYDNIKKIKNIPIIIITGRYDIITPPIMTYHIHKLLPESKIIFTNAGHSMDEPENIKYFIKAQKLILKTI